MNRVGGKRPRTVRFTMLDARKAKLIGKAGPWTDYPERMLMWRARSWACRDEFGDVLCGLGFFEEASDVPHLGPSVGEAGRPADSAPPVLAETPALAGPTASAERPTSPPPVTRDQLVRFSELRKIACVEQHCETEEEKATAWKEALAPHGVESVKGLSEYEARDLIKKLEQSYCPF